MTTERIGLFTKLVLESTEILTRRREGCEGHQVPCELCDGFCQIDSPQAARERGQSDLYDAYGPYECQGEEWFHQETFWAVCVVASNDWLSVPFVGEGQSVSEALCHADRQIDDYEVAHAAKRLEASKLGYDQ